MDGEERGVQGKSFHREWEGSERKKREMTDLGTS